MQEPLGTVRVEDKYIHSVVARKGEAVYIKDTTRATSVQQAAGSGAVFGKVRSTRSQCCVPLFAAGRFVGSLNFESRRLNGYDVSYWFTRAMGALVSVLLDEARRDHEHTAFGLAARMVIKSHALLHCRDSLHKALLSGHWEGTNRHVNDAIRELEAVLGSAAQDQTVIDQPSRECTLRELIEEVLEDVGGASWTFEPRYGASRLVESNVRVSNHRLGDKVLTADNCLPRRALWGCYVCSHLHIVSGADEVVKSRVPCNVP
jgi:hypothetical protein